MSRKIKLQEKFEIYRTNEMKKGDRVMDMVWVKSKVTIPRTVPNVLERKKLFSILSNNRMKKLTIIRSAAGYGKTTLLSLWLKHIDESVAWFTIDQNDNDPVNF